MKRYFYQTIALTCLFLIAFSTTSHAQDISEADKTEQEKVLKQDPRDFAANFILGAYYYNLAIAPLEETNKMKVVEYIENGQPFDKKKNAYLTKALPYFENCYAIGKDGDPRVKSTLKSIYQHTGVLRSSRITPEDLEAQLRDKLSKIQFKAIN